MCARAEPPGRTPLLSVAASAAADGSLEIRRVGQVECCRCVPLLRRSHLQAFKAARKVEHFLSRLTGKSTIFQTGF